MYFKYECLQVIKREATSNASGEAEIVDKKTIMERAGPPPVTFVGPPQKKKVNKKTKQTNKLNISLKELSIFKKITFDNYNLNKSYV